MNLLNPYLWLAFALVLLGSTVGGYVKGRHDGAALAQTVASAREAQVSDAMVRQIAQDAAERERITNQGQEAINTISANYQAEIAKNAQDNALALARIRSHALRLRDPGAAPARVCTVYLPHAGTGTGRRDATPTGKLSDAASEFLYSLAGEADDAARQLAACQAVVLQDRKTCNAVSNSKL